MINAKNKRQLFTAKAHQKQALLSEGRKEIQYNGKDKNQFAALLLRKAKMHDLPLPAQISQ